MFRPVAIVCTLAVILSGCASPAGRHNLYFTATELTQASNGFVSVRCKFAIYGPDLKYAVVHGMNKAVGRDEYLGQADSAEVEVFHGGSWHRIPDQRWCGTGIGVFHFVPEPSQTLTFGAMNHQTLRELLSRFGDPEMGVLVRAVFSIDLIRASHRLQTIEVRSSVCFARIGSSGIYSVLPTLYNPVSDKEAEEILIRIREEPNKSLQPTATAVMPPAAQEIMPAVAVAEH